MRRDRRQTGSTRAAKPTKMELVWAVRERVKPGPFPWDPSMPATKKPTNRELRRSFGSNFGTQKHSPLTQQER
jgi:hypothetical protein